MKPSKFTLPDSELEAIAFRRPLDPDTHGHNFRSSNFDEYEEDGVRLAMLTPHWKEFFLYRDKPDYILCFADGTPLAWYTRNIDNWEIPKLSSGLPASLYRIITFIHGLRLGATVAMAV